MLVQHLIFTYRFVNHTGQKNRLLQCPIIKAGSGSLSEKSTFNALANRACEICCVKILQTPRRFYSTFDYGYNL